MSTLAHSRRLPAANSRGTPTPAASATDPAGDGWLQRAATLQQLHPRVVLDWLIVWLMVPRVRRAVVAGAFGVALAVVLVPAAGLVGRMIFAPGGDIQTDLITPSNTQAATAAGPVTVEAYQALVDSTWFGVSDKLAQSRLTAEKVTAETTLNLSLKGTIVGASARAIIHDNAAGRTHVIAPGETLMPGVTLRQVERRRVVINNNGRLEGLSLPGENYLHNAAPATASTAPGAAPADMGDMAAAASPQRLAPQPKTASNVPLAQQEVTRRQQVSIGRKDVMSALSSLGNLGEEARFLPYVRDGEIEGFKLARLKHNSLLTKLALEEGDIVVKLDGVPVGNRDKLFPMLMNLASASTAELVVKRKDDLIAMEIAIGGV